MEMNIVLNEVETDFRLWKSWINNKNDNLSSENGNQVGFGFYYYDVQTAEYLSRWFKGYMFKPTAITDTNVHLEAKTRAARSLEELEEELSKQSKTQDLYLYTLTYTPSCPVYLVLDESTFEPKYLDKPEFRGGWWKIRYSVVER